MTIRKGEPWGESVPRPVDLVVARSDRELAGLVAGLLAGRAAGDPVGGMVGLSAGDLHRTLGSPLGAVGGAADVHRVPIDLLRCELDGVAVVAVAHVVARRGGPFGWWRGPLHAVCNAQFVGRWDVAPGGHPNDGSAEVIDVDPAMSVRQRILAWRRLPSGSHLPHPAVRLRRRDRAEWVWDRPLDVFVDGVRHRQVRHVRVEVVADAYHLHL